MIQKIFAPIKYTFEWTENWYKWDRDEAHKLALKARNKEAKRLKEDGYKIKKFSNRNQLMSLGGIGSGKPHIELLCNCYGLNAYKN